MRFKKLKQWWALVLLVILGFNVITYAMPPQHVSAAVEGAYVSVPIRSKILDHQLYYFLVSCFVNNNMDKVTLSEVNDWEWFKGQDNSAVRGGMYDNDAAKCSDGEFISEAFGQFGLDKSPLDTFCSLDFTYNRANGEKSAGDKQKCIDAQNLDDFDGADKNDWSAFQKSSIEKLLQSAPNGPTAAGSLTDAQEYVRKYVTLMNGCDIKLQREITPEELKSNNPAANQPGLFDITIVTQTGEIKHMLGGSSDKNINDATSVYLVATTAKAAITRSGGGRGSVANTRILNLPAQTITCGQLSKDLRANSEKLANAYAAYMKGPGKNDAGSVSGTSATGGAGEKSCYSEGGLLSWIMCPLLSGIDSTLDWLDKQINQLLFIDAQYYSTKNIGSSWAAMRNIAYLILIPMMLLMVIGTALGFGPFDAYTVKKALPRMLAAVIFISLSLPITQLGVIVSNNVGNGIGNFITSTVPEGKRVNSLQDIFKDYTGGSSAGSDFGLGLTAIIGIGAGYAVGFTLISFALVAAVGLLIGFTVLVMRQVLLVALIVIAPLAILAWIFPGNDKLWGIWKTTFIAMLMMYPLISILIATGKFVAGIAG